MTSALVKINYSPRKFFKPFHASGKRYSVLVCHRRAGKTVAAVNQQIRALTETNFPNPFGAYVAPTFGQAKDITWQYYKDYTRDLPGSRAFEYDLRVTLPNNAKIKLFGAENIDRLRGLYFDHIIFDEYADISPALWEDVVRPSLSDRGGKAIFMGTPKGMDAFHKLWLFAQEPEQREDWYCLDERPGRVLRASETGIIAPKELNDSFRLMGPAKYAREYECDFSATFEGSYYGTEVQRLIAENRVGSYNYDPAADVFAGWDIGIDDPMAVWTFQIINRSWVWLDYKEASDSNIQEFIYWIKQLPYKIDLHYVPHDAKARDPSDGKNRVRFMEDRGLRTYTCKKHNVEDGIAAVRMVLPRSYFNIKTQHGLSAIRMYRTTYNEKNQVLGLKPLHDWASHAADAMRSGVMGIDEEYLGMFKISDWSKPVHRPWEGSYA